MAALQPFGFLMFGEREDPHHPNLSRLCRLISPENNPLEESWVSLSQGFSEEMVLTCWGALERSTYSNSKLWDTDGSSWPVSPDVSGVLVLAYAILGAQAPRSQHKRKHIKIKLSHGWTPNISGMSITIKTTGFATFPRNHFDLGIPFPKPCSPRPDLTPLL